MERVVNRHSGEGSLHKPKKTVLRELSARSTGPVSSGPVDGLYGRHLKAPKANKDLTGTLQLCSLRAWLAFRPR